MRRRDFIKVVVGSAAAVPFAARAQQPDRIRRIGVLAGPAEDDQDNKVHLAAFVKELQQLGWTDGRNVRIDYRFAAANLENYRNVNLASIVDPSGCPHKSCPLSPQ